MRRGGAQRPIPARVRGSAGAAIDYDAMIAGGQFKGIRPGMGVQCESTWRDPAAIQQAKRAPGCQPLIAAVPGMLERLAAHFVARQKPCDHARIALAAALKQRQCTIAMAE